MLAAAFGVWRFDLTLPGTDDDVTSRVGSAVTLAGRVTDVRAYDAVITVKTADGRAAWTRSRVSVAGRGRVVGETVSVSCALAPDQKADARSTLFEMRQGIFARCRGAARVTRVKSPSSWDVAALLFRWREIMSRRVRSVLPGDEGALLAGILYGERGLSRAANLSFRNAGMTHLIAVSGSNITLIVSFFVPLFILLGYRRKSAIILSGLGILLFVLFVGAQASVVRAALMGWLALLARVFGRKAEAMRLLAIAAAIIVIFDPWALAFDAGFALSFLATWGLIAWARPIAEHLKWIPETFGLREVVATTVAATLTTTPYMSALGTTLAGLVTNLFAIPLVGFTTLLGAIALAAFGLSVRRAPGIRLSARLARHRGSRRPRAVAVRVFRASHLGIIFHLCRHDGHLVAQSSEKNRLSTARRVKIGKTACTARVCQSFLTGQKFVIVRREHDEIRQ